MEGLKILAKHNVEEGLQAGVDYLAETWDEWGADGRTQRILRHLTEYGANAQSIIPQLEEIAKLMDEADAKRREKARKHHGQKVRDAIERIKASDKKIEMIRLNLPRVGQGAAK